MKYHVTHYVGIDIGATVFVGSVFNEPDVPLETSDPFSNSPEGFEAFMKWLTEQKVVPKDSIVCMEATGVYGELLCYWLTAKGFRIAVEPPRKVKRAFETKTHKNDKVDSQQIAEYAYRYYDELKFWQPKPQLVEQIAVLLTTREQFVQQKVASVNTLKTLKRKVVQTPLANQLYDENIERLTQNIKSIEKEIQELISQNPEFKQVVNWLNSIPSVGLLLAANMLVLTNGFTQPENLNYRQLAAHIGICPYEHSSGTSVYSPKRILNQGPVRMRKLLHLAARTLRTHHPQFQNYFFRKCAQGKAPMLVLNNISNKLLRIMCAIVRTQKPYINGYISINPSLTKNA